MYDDEAHRRAWFDVLPIPPEFVPSSGTLWKASQATVKKGEMAWNEVVEKTRRAILTELPVQSLLS